MTNEELMRIKARLGSLSPARIQQLRALSESCYKLIVEDLPILLTTVSEQLDLLSQSANQKKEHQQSSQLPRDLPPKRLAAAGKMARRPRVNQPTEF